MQDTPALVVFSDLDGTLLDHKTYSWEPAQPALSRLRHLGIPLILASSKTGQEIKRIQSEMRLEAYPAIAENGAGVVPAGSAAGGQSDVYVRLRGILDQVSAPLRQHFVGFGDMSDEEVARATALPVAAASLARVRQFSEPGLWTGSQQQRTVFLQEIEALGLSAREGGRFLTLSFGSTKKDRMNEITALYKGAGTLALGDAPNDREMIEHADHGVIVANPHGADMPRLKGELDGSVQRTKLPGPAGWNAAVNDFLDRWTITEGAQGIG